MSRYISTACRYSPVPVTVNWQSTPALCLILSDDKKSTCFGVESTVLCLYAVQHNISHNCSFQQTAINNLYLQLAQLCYCHSRSPWYLHIWSDRTESQLLFLYCAVLCGGTVLLTVYCAVLCGGTVLLTVILCCVVWRYRGDGRTDGWAGS